MILKWLFIFLAVYFFYKLIFDFILPVSKASSQIRSKMNEMHQQQHQQPPGTDKAQAQTTVRPPKDDYIDFEEVK